MPEPLRFDRASKRVLTYLRGAVPMGMWTVTRVVDNKQVYLTVDDVAYGIPPGASVDWSATLCQHMVRGDVPRICIDVRRYPHCADIVTSTGAPVLSYIGLPIVISDGTLFGTLCGFSTTTQEPEIEQHDGLLQLLTDLLSSVLESDLDQTEILRTLERTELRASTDPLTGLPNRGAWDRLLEQEEERYRRFGDSCALICIDLNELKAINDRDGHPAGDELLRLVARTLAENVRETDVVARVGGDEFGVLAAATTEPEAVALVHRLRAALAAVGASASFGHAQYVMTDGFAKTWKTADAAMYAEKRLRR